MILYGRGQKIDYFLKDFYLNFSILIDSLIDSKDSIKELIVKKKNELLQEIKKRKEIYNQKYQEFLDNGEEGQIADNMAEGISGIFAEDLDEHKEEIQNLYEFSEDKFSKAIFILANTYLETGIRNFY